MRILGNEVAQISNSIDEILFDRDSLAKFAEKKEEDLFPLLFKLSCRVCYLRGITHHYD